MPAVRKQDPWETALRSQVRALGKGWGVQEERGRVRVNLRPPGEKSQSVTLGIQWSERSAGDAYTRVRNLFGLVAAEGYN